MHVRRGSIPTAACSRCLYLNLRSLPPSLPPPLPPCFTESPRSKVSLRRLNFTFPHPFLPPSLLPSLLPLSLQLSGSSKHGAPVVHLATRKLKKSSLSTLNSWSSPRYAFCPPSLPPSLSPWHTSFYIPPLPPSFPLSLPPSLSPSLLPVRLAVRATRSRKVVS